MAGEEVMLALERASALNEVNRHPNEGILWGFLAIALRMSVNKPELGDDERDRTLAEALAAADRAVGLDPDEGVAQAIRSAILALLGRFEEAVAAAREGVRLDPESWDCHYALADVLMINPLTRPEGIRVARAAIGLAPPEEPRVHQVTGIVALFEKRWSDAEQAFRTLLAIRPEDPDALRGLAAAQQRQWDMAGLATSLQAAATADPTSEQTLRTVDTRVSQFVMTALMFGPFVLAVLLFSLPSEPGIGSAVVTGLVVLGTIGVQRGIFKYGVPPDVAAHAAARLSRAPLLLLGIGLAAVSNAVAIGGALIGIGKPGRATLYLTISLLIGLGAFTVAALSYSRAVALAQRAAGARFGWVFPGVPREATAIRLALWGLLTRTSVVNAVWFGGLGLLAGYSGHRLYQGLMLLGYFFGGGSLINYACRYGVLLATYVRQHRLPIPVTAAGMATVLVGAAGYGYALTSLVQPVSAQWLYATLPVCAAVPVLHFLVIFMSAVRKAAATR